MKKIHIFAASVFCATVFFSGCTLPKLPTKGSNSVMETKTETTQESKENGMVEDDTLVTTTNEEKATPVPTSTDLNSLEKDLDTFTLEGETFN